MKKINRMKQGIMGVLLGLACWLSGQAQDYHAIEGSPFAGSLGVANNPASILSTPYPWDLTIFSMQLKNTTNAVTFQHFSLLGTGDTIGYHVTGGNFKRYASFNYNVHLLNARIALGRGQAIAFGANLRGYGTARTGRANYNDSLGNMNDFFNINEGTTYQASVVSSSWLELFGTYSRALIDDSYGRLNAGATLRLMRGISGGYAQLQGGLVDRTITGPLTVYNMDAGSGRYGYSSNYDWWHSYNSTGQNLKDFLGHTSNGAAVDLGVEYLIKTQDVHKWDDPDDYYEYEWKIGVSLLDLGANTYKYGSQSRAASNPKSSITDADLNARFDTVTSLAGFNNSLASIVNNIQTLSGNFHIWNPARLVINVDRPLPGHFAVNADLTLNLGGNNNGKQLFTKEITLLALTPRWETKSLGGYLPIQVTTDGKVWVGGAVKAGPLLLGVHNWSNVFSKNKIANGGFYLAIVLRPGKGFLQKEDKKYTCPKY